jgi:hypothetical protein
LARAPGRIDFGKGGTMIFFGPYWSDVHRISSVRTAIP